MPTVEVVAGQIVVVQTRAGRGTHIADPDREGVTLCGDAWLRKRLGVLGDPTCAWCRGAFGPWERHES